MIDGKISKSFAKVLEEIETKFKGISSNPKLLKEFQDYLVFDILNEYFRNKEKNLNIDLYTTFVRNFLVEAVGDDFTHAMCKLVFLLSVYEDNIKDLNELVYKMKVKLSL